VHDTQFKTSKEVLAGKRKELKERGKGNREKRAEPLTPDEEEKLWQSGELGSSNPTSLQQTLWFLTTKHMGKFSCCFFKTWPIFY
jgi:hypothetical protein